MSVQPHHGRGTAIRTLVVIPSRYPSTRLPAKALADLGGRPLVAHVVAQALAANVGRVVVATDDERIGTAARAAGAEPVMTPAECRTGSDRIAAALRAMPHPDDRDDDIIINVQGDEPFIEPELIRDLADVLRNEPDTVMATVATPARPGDREDPATVTVVLGHDDTALYFSRSAIPGVGPGATEAQARAVSLRHLGLYAYRRAFLHAFVAWPPGRLEVVESLEQLRAVERGVRIRVIVRPTESIGIDTPADLERARRRLAGTDTGR
jgi:3-deoxy-manno-octulosonate cytidylyltransferase (CMP-KDO synthetase)